MNKSILRSIALGLVVALTSLPLYAQTASSTSNEKDETIAKVQTDGGVIMISEDAAEFQTAVPDQRVKEKARLMVSEDSSATVVYDNGCDQKYDKPGVYEISRSCVPALVLGSGGVSKGWIVAGVIVGTAVLVSIIDDGNDNDSPPPVSR